MIYLFIIIIIIGAGIITPYNTGNMDQYKEYNFATNSKEYLNNPNQFDIIPLNEPIHISNFEMVNNQ